MPRQNIVTHTKKKEEEKEIKHFENTIEQILDWP